MNAQTDICQIWAIWFFYQTKIFATEIFFVTVYVRASQQKFGPKIKNFKIFFDIIFNHTCVHMHIKKNFKIFHFLAKFLNFLEGPPIKNFLNRFFSTGMNSQTIFHIDSGWFLTFGLGPLSGELCSSSYSKGANWL